MATVTARSRILKRLDELARSPKAQAFGFASDLLDLKAELQLRDREMTETRQLLAVLVRVAWDLHVRAVEAGHPPRTDDDRLAIERMLELRQLLDR